MSLTTSVHETIRQVLSGKSKDEYGPSFEQHVLDIYKLYVQMADEVSRRRQAANSFYLTVNAALIGTSAYIGALKSTHSDVWIIAAAGIAVCWMWLRNIVSYKSLNSGKFAIVNEIENLLPLRPYQAEWEFLKRGSEKSIHVPFHAVERWVPIAFMLVHVFVLVAALWRVV